MPISEDYCRLHFQKETRHTTPTNSDNSILIMSIVEIVAVHLFKIGHKTSMKSKKSDNYAICYVHLYTHTETYTVNLLYISLHNIQQKAGLQLSQSSWIKIIKSKVKGPCKIRQCNSFNYYKHKMYVGTVVFCWETGKVSFYTTPGPAHNLRLISKTPQAAHNLRLIPKTQLAGHMS